MILRSQLLHLNLTFYSLFLSWLLLLSIQETTNLFAIGIPKVAVCITGQIDRWIPDAHVTNLVHANPNVSFSFFFNLQFSNQTEYNYAYGIPSNVTELEFWKTFEIINDMYTARNSEVISLKFDILRNLTVWQKVFKRGNASLDRIYQYTKRQHIILNMYNNHDQCIKDIVNYEKRFPNNSFQFDYIINAREDLFYFHPMYLNYSFDVLANDSCGLVAKGCIMNYGVNMRMQIARRNHGIKIFGTKLPFYYSLWKNRTKIKNPERFELFQLQSYNLLNCTLPVDYFPITAARINENGSLCLLEKEIQSLARADLHSCIPLYYYQTAMDLRCSIFDIKPPYGFETIEPTFIPTAQPTISPPVVKKSSPSLIARFFSSTTLQRLFGGSSNHMNEDASSSSGTSTTISA